MVGTSFRSWTAFRVYPRPSGRKRSSLAVLVLLLAAGSLAGCGGGGGEKKPRPATTQTITSPGYRFEAPRGWVVVHGPRKVEVSPERGADTLVSVHVFRTVKPYRPGLWPQVVTELDRNAAELAKELDGRIASRSTITVAGDKAREYLIEYGPKKGRYTFLFRARTEYELICQWPSGESEPEACSLLVRTFRPG